MKSLFVVLLSSTQTTPGSQATGLEAGADGYIARPIENRELLARLQSLLRIQRAEAGLRRAQEQLEERVRERTTELARANDALREMSLRLVEVQEAERRSLARELHDEAGQILTGLKLILDQCVPLVPELTKERLGEAMALIHDLLSRVRELSLQLRPAMLDDLGLRVALEWHFQRYTRQTGILVDFKYSPLPERLPVQLESAVFRIVQESLTNAARHAQVDRVSVRLWVDGFSVGVQINDHGKGFDAGAALGSGRSSGLRGMKERVDLLGGSFALETRPGHGTRLTIEFPRRAPSNITPPSLTQP